MNLPKVAILMAIYKPNMEWLKEQLISIEQQTYRNLCLIVYIDEPNDSTNYDLLLKKYITKMPYELHKGENNLGTTKAFELLAKLTKNREDIKYLTYCDPDDICLPEKTAALVNIAEKENLDLVCSDMSVIDKDGKFVHNSFLRHQKFYDLTRRCTRDNLFKVLAQRNFISACAMLIRREVANEPMPYSPKAHFDHWLAIYVAGTTAKFKLYDAPLLKHRIHDNNFSLSRKVTYEEGQKIYIGIMEDIKINMSKVVENKNNAGFLERYIAHLKSRFIQYEKRIGKK